jgi:transposase-like protein
MNKEKKTMLDELEKDSEGFDFKHFDKMLLAHVKKNGGKAAVMGPGLLKELTRRTYQALLDAELEEHLGYSKNDSRPEDNLNARNGRGRKTIKGDL